MSEAKKINAAALLAALPEDGYVPVVDSGGSVRRVSVANLLSGVRDSIKIGGRNLLPKSNLSFGSLSGYSYADGVHACRYVNGTMGVYKKIGLYPTDTTYVVSGEFKSDVDNHEVRWYLANNEASAISFYVTKEWKRYSAVVKPTDGNLQCRLTSCNYANTFYARNLKIECGNIATDWTPAPEDYMLTNGTSGGG